MKTLDEIAIACQTDRATVFTRTYAKPHGYAPQYDRLFSPLRSRPVKLLEIGVGGGESIQMWLEYFPNAKIFGVDTSHDTNSWDTPGTKDRYTFVNGDQSSMTFWACFLADYGAGWDIIIDDGGHFANQIITTFDAMWPALNPGGLYAIEDLGVSYGEGSVFVPPPWPNHMDYIKAKLDEINLGHEIEWAHFSKELAVFKKAP